MGGRIPGAHHVRSPPIDTGGEKTGREGDQMDTKGEQRQRFFDSLLDALEPWSSEVDSTPRTFAACETVKCSQGFILKSFHVAGAGELQLPLSREDVPALRRVCEQAPFGQGLSTLVDTSVRRCWQVDASKVSFPGAPNFLAEMIQPLAVKAIRALGVDGERVQIEARPYKLLLYEEGGHFTFHRDTEKEKGMFATFILQIPTEEGYTGGKLVVQHKKSERASEEKEFDCHMVSSLGFCYTVFFADCLHQLRKIESGTRLCLVFNLVKGDSSSDHVHREFLRVKVQEVEAALQPWLQEATEGRSSIFGAKIAIPLQHKYTAENLSFPLLKGDDSLVAEVLKECRDQAKEKSLELYLCLLTKYETGRPSNASYRMCRTYYDSDFEEGYQDVSQLSMEDAEETIEFEKWIGENDEPPSVMFKHLDIDRKREIVVSEGMDPFDSEPDDTEYEGYLGNSGPTLEYWYHTAMLVAWPKILAISVACEANFSLALDFLEEKSEISRGQVHQVVCFCENNTPQVWGSARDATKDSVTPRLLRLSHRACALELVLRILNLLAGAPRFDHGGGNDRTFKIGVRNVAVANAIAIAVQVCGWEAVSKDVVGLARDRALDQSESLVHLAKRLISMGHITAGELVADTIRRILTTRIAGLDLHKMPVFTWYQPDAKLPGYPDVERFLKGPHPKTRVTGFQGIAGARSFAQNYFSFADQKLTGYSAVATPVGIGRAAACEIQKTRHVFDTAMDAWRRQQGEIERLRHELWKLELGVPETITTTAATVSNWQHDPKRQKLDMAASENDAEIRSTVEVMDLTLLNSGIPMWARGT